MSVSRKDLIKYLNANGFFFLRERGNHTIYSDGKGNIVPVKRHKIFDRISANEICKEAGLPEAF